MDIPTNWVDPFSTCSCRGLEIGVMGTYPAGMEIFDGGFEETRFGIAGGIFLLGFIAVGIFGAILYLVQLGKGLAKKETRADTIKEVKQSVEGVADAGKFIATDKDFHKELRREFKPQIFLVAVLGVMLVLMALGVD